MSSSRKNKYKLNLRSNSKSTDLSSPKTPPIKIMALDSPVSTSKTSTCSTPLSTVRNNNNMFYDESPVLDESVTLTYSQDFRQLDTDVTWQWDSPKRHIVTKNIKKIEVSELRKHKKKNLAKTDVKKNKTMAEPTGFNKFQADIGLLWEQGSIKISNDDLSTSIQPITPEKLKTIKMNDSDVMVDFKQKNHCLGKTRVSLSKTCNGTGRTKFLDVAEVLNDSDLELIKCTELFEETLQNKQVLNNNNSNNTKIPAFDDSLDELFSDIPLDEVISEYNCIKNEQQKIQALLINKKKVTLNKIDNNTDSSGYSSPLIRKNLLRHSSMPHETIMINENITNTINMKLNECDRQFVRHLSMPLEETSQNSNAPSTNSSLDSLVSTSSSSQKRCSAEEIEEKRRQAIQRLRLNKIYNKNINKFSRK